MKTRKRKARALRCALFAAALQSFAVPAPEIDPTAGADIRLRYDGTDNLPDAGGKEAKASDYARVRIRPWFKASCNDSGLYLPRRKCFAGA